MKIKEIICALEHFAPLPLQESYDNAGLQVGLTAEQEASGALLCLDVTEEVIREAVDLGCNLIVAHHPLLFRPLKRVTDGTQVERCVRLAIQNDIAIYAAHTNLDNAEDGVNYRIAEKLGLVDVQMMQPHTVDVGDREVVAGSGLIGYLPGPEDSLAFLQRIKDVFHIEMLQHNELLQRPIQTVALCGGAGAFLLSEAIRLEADAFLTGEMSYHQFFGHEQEIQLAVMGHYQSEQYTKEIFYQLISDMAPGLPLFVTNIDTNPIRYL
ncbi:MAG: Nif3-like dinuclear metal center hexameric protein [Bacteroidaceae bacterium]|nr:Nif3-like dinuclear metal center hexameric protein [Bacteroidaceae bacterium]